MFQTIYVSCSVPNTPELLLQRTIFGRVLSELLEERGVAATPETVGQRVLDRMVTRDVPSAGSLQDLADELGLDVEERIRLSQAFTWEKELLESLAI